MTGLPWVRLDANIATHDKILELVNTAGGYRSAFVYCCSLAYAGGHGTDGIIPFAAVGMIHGTRREASMLVDHGLWKPHRRGWLIHNWAERQQSTERTEALQEALSRGGKVGACRRWHNEKCDGECGCSCHKP